LLISVASESSSDLIASLRNRSEGRDDRARDPTHPGVQPSFCDDEEARDATRYRKNDSWFPDELYRLLPSVNEVLLKPAAHALIDSHPRHRLLSSIREALATLRLEIAAGQHTAATLDSRLAGLFDQVIQLLNSPKQYSLRPVINATGVILHTNLGRAPLSKTALDHIVEVARDYCNLELDVETGTRSRRDVHADSLVLRVLSVTNTERHGVVIVNNCAAATFLALNSLAEKQEVVVSRGELVEIGGGFRIPEILEKSAAILKEVGTTNRTRLADYERGLSPATALILRVHQSNFSIEGSSRSVRRWPDRCLRFRDALAFPSSKIRAPAWSLRLRVTEFAERRAARIV
jgi:L-seryl-tRNA(Sec) selenium transferase